MPDLYLASRSPRRRELLSQVGVSFSVLEVNVPEQQRPGESAADYVQRLALSKAQAGATLVDAKPVLGADTIVVLGQQVLEKPTSESQAIDMLMALSAKTHQVMTAVAVCQGNRCESRLVTTAVTFRAISESEARRYWATGEPIDKAGGYGIQGLGGAFVTHLDGSYFSVVGLPLTETVEILAKFAVPYGLSV